MSEQTKIEWADSTLNFWSGCTKVSAGCAHCYAETLSNRKLTNAAGELNIGQWGKGAPRKRHQSAFNLALRLNRQPWVCGCEGKDGSTALEPAASHCSVCKEQFHRRRVFSLSLGDWLDPEVPIEWLAEMLDTIRICDQLQWLLVTKRPELFEQRLTEVMKWHENKPCAGKYDQLWHWLLCWVCGEKVPPNIMVLTSVEDQKAADERIPALLKIPAAQRGLSCEPLLGPVDFGHIKPINKNAPCSTNALTGVTSWPDNDTDEGRKIDWVIIGGESGPGARACNVEWIRSIVEQCRAAGVAAFVKQLGARPQSDYSVSRDEWLRTVADKKGGNITEWPVDLRVREFPNTHH
jgi:protein gp37